MKRLLALLPILMIAACDRPPKQAAEPDVAGPEREVMEPQLAEDLPFRDKQEQFARDRDAAEAEAQRSALAATREWELNQRAQELAAREAELGMREQVLSERELESAGREVLDSWAEDVPDVYHQPVADYGLFYDGLDPYGQWFDSPQYGYIYQPAVVVQDRSWRPYTHGHWVCTDYGWTWMSDEPFGWATYHYGRWVLLNQRGWCWVPGNEWAPSWVAWRHGGGHVGWAPLPPETMSRPGASWGVSVELDFGIADNWFSFVDERYIAEPIARHCLPVGRNMALRRAARGCTNLHFRNGRAIAGGPSFAALRQHVSRPWSVGRLEMDPLVGLAKRDQRGVHRDGDRYRVFAPNVGTSWNTGLRPRRVAGRIDQVEVARSRAEMKPEWTARYRETREQQRQSASKLAVRTSSDRDRQLAANREQLRRAMEDRNQRAAATAGRGLPEGVMVDRDRSSNAMRDRVIGRDDSKGQVSAVENDRRGEGRPAAVRGERQGVGEVAPPARANRTTRTERVTPVPGNPQGASNRVQQQQVEQQRRAQQEAARQSQQQQLEQQRGSQQQRVEPQRRAQQEAANRAQQQRVEQEVANRVQQQRLEQQRGAQQEAARQAQQQRLEQQRGAEQEAARRVQQERVGKQRQAQLDARQAQQEAARRAQQQQLEQQRGAQQEAASRAQQQRRAEQEAANRAQQQRVEQQRRAEQEAANRAQQQQQMEQQRRAQQEAESRAQQQRVEQQRRAEQEAANRAQQQQLEQQRRAQQEAARQAQQQQMEQQRQAQQQAARQAQQQQMEQQRQAQQEAANRAQQQQMEQQRQAQQQAARQAQQQQMEQQRQAQQEAANRAQQQQMEQQRQAQQEAARRDAGQQQQRGQQQRNMR